MFNLSEDEITFEKVEEFCREWQEGVRVEYKSQIHKAMPKTLSSFANTQGGVLIIGVEADKTHNKVKFPIEGIPKEPGIEERIVQSGLMGINPPVMPEVSIIDVPDTENIVIVVCVDVSEQAPHAIQNSTRVYERVASVSQPYELAQIERIEYLLNRRQEPQRVAQQILDQIDSSRKLGSAESGPTITIVARPVFPDRPVISPSKIWNLFGHWYGSSRVPGGICIESGEQSHRRITQFHEYGIVYRKEAFEALTLQICVFRDVIYKFMKFAKEFYSNCDYFGNLEVSVELKNVQSIKLLNFLGDHSEIRPYNFICSDPEVRATTSAYYLAQELREPETRRRIAEELLRKILWAFNVPSDNRSVIQEVKDIIDRVIT